MSVDRLGSEILRSRSLFISEPSSPQVGRGAERSGRLLYLPFVASYDEAPIFLEVARFMSANAVRVNHLDEVKGVSEEALESGVVTLIRGAAADAAEKVATPPGKRRVMTLHDLTLEYRPGGAARPGRADRGCRARRAGIRARARWR